MTCQIKCKTLFDITVTGVRSNYSSARIPFTDETGKVISSQDLWNRSRNQQRNWETINQIISLRTLPYNITDPVKNNDNCWEFEFTIDSIESISTSNNTVGALLKDAAGVPMILGLDETPTISTVLCPFADGTNIWFTADIGK